MSDRLPDEVFEDPEPERVSAEVLRDRVDTLTLAIAGLIEQRNMAERELIKVEGGHTCWPNALECTVCHGAQAAPAHVCPVDGECFCCNPLEL